MFQFIVRLLLVVACSVSGYFIVLEFYIFPYSLIGLAAGFFVAILVIQIERSIRNISLRVIFGGAVGTSIGFFIAVIFVLGLRCIPGWEKQELIPWEYIYIILSLVLGYLGLFLGSKKSREAAIFLPDSRKDCGEVRDYRILDTSVIIDGRIADVSDTGFVHGDLIVPRFVLDELQQIADSSDHMKRSRGRRGLDILNRMQKSEGIHIDIVDTDFPKIKGVDAKLIALAAKEEGKIVTNDYNLNKVAELQGIKILNVNELANALKPVVLPGESMVVKIIKDGKEQGQGVAYLDDGTMVIVDSGSNFIGKTVQVVVTSVLQTTAGRMIFSNMKESTTSNK